MCPPKCTFQPPFFHPNVSSYGTVFSSQLNKDTGWYPAIMIKQILMNIQNLLNNPDLNYPIHLEAYTLFCSNRFDYEKRIRSSIKYASKYMEYVKSKSQYLVIFFSFLSYKFIFSFITIALSLNGNQNVDAIESGGLSSKGTPFTDFFFHCELISISFFQLNRLVLVNKMLSCKMPLIAFVY